MSNFTQQDQKKTTDKKGPFSSEEASNIIMPAIQKIISVNMELQLLACDVVSLRLNFFESLYSKKLKDLEDRYHGRVGVFVNLYQIWSTPDTLFKSDKKRTPEESVMLIRDREKMQPAVEKHFDEALKMISTMQTILNFHKSNQFNRLTIILGVLAVIATILFS